MRPGVAACSSPPSSVVLDASSVDVAIEIPALLGLAVKIHWAESVQQSVQYCSINSVI